MIKKTFILLAVAMFALLMSCGDDKVNPDKPETPPQKIDSEAKLQVSARDVSTGELVGATVNLHAFGEREIPQGGAAEFMVPIGTHRLSVSKEGYAPIEMTSRVYSQISGKTLIAKDTAVTAQLYPLAAGLSGTLTYTNKYGREVPAAGVTVRVTFNKIYDNNCNLVVAEFTDLTVEAKTNAAGKYTFSSLPAIGNNSTCYGDLEIYSVVALPTTLADGTYFSELPLDAPSLKKGTVTQNDPENLTIVNSQFRVIEYTKSIDSSSVIEIEFNDVVNMELVTPTTIGVAPNQAVNLSWTPATAPTKLTIAPIGKWTSDIGVTFSNTSLISVKGQAINVTSLPTNVKLTKADMTGEDGKVEGLVYFDTNSVATLRINGNTKTVDLSWNTVAGAEGYRVWVAKKVAVGEPEYVIAKAFVATLGAPDYKIKGNVVSGEYYFSDGTDVKLGGDAYIFKVQALTTGSFSTEGSLELAETKVVSDTTRPRLANSISDSLHKPNLTVNGQDLTIKFRDAYSGLERDPAGFNTAYGLQDWLDAEVAPTAPNDTIARGVVNFNELMNAEKALNIAISAKTSTTLDPTTKMSIAYEWEKANQDDKFSNKLILKVIIKDGAVVEGDMDWIYSITGLRDMAGNALTYTYYPNITHPTAKSTAGTSIDSTVALRFHISKPHVCNDTGAGVNTACQTYCATAEAATDDMCTACNINGTQSAACCTGLPYGAADNTCGYSTFCMVSANANVANCTNNARAIYPLNANLLSYCKIGAWAYAALPADCGWDAGYINQCAAGDETNGIYAWDSDGCRDFCIAMPQRPVCADQIEDIFTTTAADPAFKAYCTAAFVRYGGSVLLERPECDVFAMCEFDNTCAATCTDGTDATCTITDCANNPTWASMTTDACGDINATRCVNGNEPTCQGYYANTSVCGSSLNVGPDGSLCGKYNDFRCTNVADGTCSGFFGALCPSITEANEPRCVAYCIIQANAITAACNTNPNGIFGSNKSDMERYCQVDYRQVATPLADFGTSGPLHTQCQVFTDECDLFGANDIECKTYCEFLVDEEAESDFLAQDKCHAGVEFCGSDYFSTSDLCTDNVAQCATNVLSEAGCLCDEDLGYLGFDDCADFRPVQFSPIQQTKLKKVAKR